MQQAKERKKQLEKPEKKVRPDWSPAQQNIDVFLKSNPPFAEKIKTVRDDEPYLIDLLEKVETGFP
jgi:hypothetical protein